MSGFSGGGSDDNVNVELNLVPLIDILTNILFFLLMGFASQEIKFEGNIKLPAAPVENEFSPTVSIKIAKHGILVQDIQVTKIKDGKIQGITEGVKIEPLFAKLTELREVQKKQAGPDGKVNDVIFLFADKKIPYTLLSPVLKTAAMSGYPNFRFAVVKK